MFTRRIYGIFFLITILGLGLAGCGGTERAAENIPLTIDTQPVNQTVEWGQSATFTVVATGSGTLSYQWRKGGTNIQGSTRSTYTTQPTIASDNGTSFDVVVTNTIENSSTATTSNLVTLTVGVPDAFTSANHATFTVGLAGSFTVTTADSAAPVLTETGALPPGVTFTSGVLGGTPAAGTGGTYPITFIAHEGVVPDDTQNFTLTVNQPAAVPLQNAVAPQTTPTYDGSGQITEPSIRFFISGWNGYQYWLVVQPYPNSNASKENPSILVSNDGSSWIVPPGLVNPIALPTFPSSTGHFDDGDLFYDAVSEQLWVYYVWEDYNGHPGITHVLRRTSSDGVHWSDAMDLIQIPGYGIVSPTVEKIGNNYYMWSTNVGKLGCSSANTTLEYRISSDGIHWSLPQPVNISQPGYVVWHLEVESVPSMQEYWMLYAAYPTGKNCGSTVLFFAKSSDGVNWTTYSHAALGHGSGWDSVGIYRSTFVYDSAQNLINVWYSALSSVPGMPGARQWHQGFTSGNYTGLLEYLQQ